MKYQVIWLDEAVAALQRLYEAELDKEGLAHVIVRIGIELSANPAAAGESRDENARILFKFPLIVRFRLNERLSMVSIYDVRRFPRRT